MGDNVCLIVIKHSPTGLQGANPTILRNSFLQMVIKLILFNIRITITVIFITIVLLSLILGQTFVVVVLIV
jgi:hypothetical protein